MRRLGTVLHTTHNGYIVVVLEDKYHIPPLNINIYDGRRRKLGTLLDIIGPIDKPYAVVKPLDKSILREVVQGTILYYEGPRLRRRRKHARKLTTRHVSKKGRLRPRTSPKFGKLQGGGKREGGGRRKR